MHVEVRVLMLRPSDRVACCQNFRKHISSSSILLLHAAAIDQSTEAKQHTVTVTDARNNQMKHLFPLKNKNKTPDNLSEQIKRRYYITEFE
jgi:hypothetical protein